MNTRRPRAVFDDTRAIRKVEWINNFWKALANQPPTLQRIWRGLKEVMAPGALDPLTKELIYLAVSISNGGLQFLEGNICPTQPGHDPGISSSELVIAPSCQQIVAGLIDSFLCG